MTRMTYGRILTAALLSMLGLGCAGPATGTGAGLADGGSVSSAAALCGIWHGYFGYSGDDNLSSWGSSELTLQILEDSTYTLQWGNRPASTGSVGARGNRVILNDASGSQVTLVHAGDTLYGVMRDGESGRPAVISLEKQASATGRFAAISRGCAESPVSPGGHRQPA